MKNILLISLLTFSSLFAQNITDGLLLHYEFNGNAIDSSINSHHGTISGTTFGLDRFENPNSAAYFDGIDDFIDLPNLIELKPNLPVSFSFWIKYDSQSFQDRAVFNTSFEDDRSTGVYFNTQITTGNYAINFGDGTYNYISTTRRTLTSNESIENTNWHHIAVIVRSATDMSIFVDCKDYKGEYSGTGGGLVYSNTPGSIGRRDRNLGVPANYFKGILDDFRYWDRELSISDINYLCGILSVSEFDSDSNSIIVYPNPSNGIVNINSSIEFNSIVIHNTLGQQIIYLPFNKRIDLGFIPNGIYYMSLIKEDLIIKRKIVLNNLN
jgi:hypothetical protein